MTKQETDFYRRLAHGLAVQFGPNCEIVVHELDPSHKDSSIIAIENGNVSGRKVGDGPSHIVLETLKENPEKIEDRLAYLTRTRDGKILRSSTIYLRDNKGKVNGILSINYDISVMVAYSHELNTLITTDENKREPATITENVSDLLEELIRQSIDLVGKPVQMMTKDDKIKALRYLNDTGALLITKSGPRICEVFGFSKYTLYNYLEEIKNSDTQNQKNES
ncbi:MAG: helix-turn-helix transcriptional regulator [Eubacteriales bacterium]|jgi:predicted transcriptional regulator YheO